MIEIPIASFPRQGCVECSGPLPPTTNTPSPTQCQCGSAYRLTKTGDKPTVWMRSKEYDKGYDFNYD
ncbi:unnamed protein product [marine sediment metagenome]|uniref:Uncharacterized protein n=1 Tax=marine sediment metagenome TaxID=412755 RepID=X0V662_9ZZZZ